MQRLTFLYLGSYLVAGGLAGDYRYYTYTVLACELVVAALTALYLKTRDTLFVSLNVIVLVGLVPSLYVAARMQRDGPSHP
jgi:uncharacterized membrane protein